VLYLWQAAQGPMQLLGLASDLAILIVVWISIGLYLSRSILERQETRAPRAWYGPVAAASAGTDSYRHGHSAVGA
jgi:hypothetical protein